MILEPVGGLCNRLRAMLSRLEPEMTIYWSRNWECADAAWSDVFEPIRGVRIVDDRPEHVDLTTCDAAAWTGWEHRMFELVPKPHIRARVDELRAQLLPFDAMFIRRTDGTWIAREEGNFTPDDVFHRFAESAPGKVFLATDNGETIAKVRGWIGDRCVVVGEMTGREEVARGDHTRHQSLADSIVNLYLCVEAERFIGSEGSSFATMIRAMRKLKGRS